MSDLKDRARELAEKINDAIFPDGIWPGTKPKTVADILPLIETALREAEIKARIEPPEDHRFHFEVGGCQQCFENSLMNQVKVAEIMNQASLDERERCAKIVDKFSKEFAYAEDIAKAIRKQGEK